MTTTIRAVAAVLGLGALLAGCGAAPSTGSSTTGTTTSTAAPTQSGPDINTPEGRAEADSIKFENLMADCMKAAGFQYVPHPQHYTQPAGNVAGKDPATVPYDVLKTYRQKYGYGYLYASDVYPNDPNVVQAYRPDQNPNNAIREGLDPARRKAYDLALEGVTDPGFDHKGTSNGKKGDVTKPGCAAKAGTQVYGDTKPDEAGQKAKERSWSAFQTDPEAVAAAQKWADCLRGRGYKVEFTRPGEIETALASMAMDGKLPAGPGAPAGVPTEGAVTAAAGGGNAVPPAAAQAGLQLEIKAALADLDCRTDYATLVRTKYAKVLRDGDGKS